MLAETWEERQERLLRQMAGNPKVAYRLEHGVLPHWMSVAKEHREQEERAAREASMPEPEPEPEPAPLPRGRHRRAPRRRSGWAAKALAYGLVLAVGVMIGQVGVVPLW